MRKNNMHNTCKYLFYNNARAAPLCHAPQFTAQSLRRYFLWENVERKMGNAKRRRRQQKHNKIRRNFSSKEVQLVKSFLHEKGTFAHFFCFFFIFFLLFHRSILKFLLPFGCQQDAMPSNSPCLF